MTESNETEMEEIHRQEYEVLLYLSENCAVQGNQRRQLCHYPKRANELTENMRRRVNGHQLVWNGQVSGKTSLSPTQVLC